MPYTNTAPSEPTTNPVGRQRDWAAYDAALVNRGRFDVYIDQEVLDCWEGSLTGRFDAPTGSFDVAVLTVLTLKHCYQLANRQCEGFTRAILDALGRDDLNVPDHTTMSRRARRLDVELATCTIRAAFAGAATRRRRSTPSIAIDSTGLAVCGAHPHRDNKWGEDTRRSYRKVHISTDPRTGQVTAVETTPSDGEGTGDVSVAPVLLDAHIEAEGWVPDRLYADGAYDAGWLAEHCDSLGVTLVTPPDVNATVATHLRAGDGYQVGSRCRNVVDQPGYTHRNRRVLSRTMTGSDDAWKTEEEYGQRAHAEVVNSRFIAAFGDRLRARLMGTQIVEVRVKARLLNLWRAAEIEAAGGYLSFEAR